MAFEAEPIFDQPNTPRPRLAGFFEAQQRLNRSVQERQALSEAIRVNAEKISNVLPLRQTFFDSLSLFEQGKEVGIAPEDLAGVLVTRSRAEILQRNFSDFFEQEFGLIPAYLFGEETPTLVLERAIERAASEDAKNILYQLARARENGLTAADLRAEFEIEDSKTKIGKVDDNTDIIFLDILRSPELRARWLNFLYNVQKQRTAENLNEIDESQGERVKKDLVIVGGGPLTSIAVTILSPYYNITIITEQESVGEPWLSRYIYLNSPVEQQNLDVPRFPLQESSSTSPISPIGFINVPDLGQLVNDDALTRVCDVPEVTRRYPSGRDLGVATATNIAYYASDYIVGQRVLTQRTEINDDGSVKLKIRDKFGTTRELDANKVLFLTGPGKETCRIPASTARILYRQANDNVEALIEGIREGIEFPESLSDELPNILTLTMIEKLSRLWQVDLQRDPNNFPFQNLFRADTRIGFVGTGDTTRVLLELFGQGSLDRGSRPENSFGGPPEFYPEGVERTTLVQDIDQEGKIRRTEVVESLENPSKIVFGEGDLAKRRRYLRSADERTETLNGRVTQVLPTLSGRLEVLIETPNGINRERVDYLFVNTGLERTPIDEQFKNLALQTQLDQDSNTVGLAAYPQQDFVGASVLIGGSATQFTKEDFPEEIQNVINLLGIGENTIALWVHGLLCEKLLWTDLALSPNAINRKRVSQLLGL